MKKEYLRTSDRNFVKIFGLKKIDEKIYIGRWSDHV